MFDTSSDCDIQTGQRVYPPPEDDNNKMADLLPEQLPPNQRVVQGSENKNDDDADLKLTCTPSLGQPTIIPTAHESVWFSVIVEYPRGGWREPQICLWHNHNGEHDWNELHLKPTSGIDDQILLVDSSAEQGEKKANRILFQAELSGLPKHGHMVSFTLKYRIGSSSYWQWIKDRKGLQDGELCYQSVADLSKHSSYELKHFIEDISEDIKILAETPETKSTHLYSLTCPVKPAKGKSSGYQHHRLGKAKHNTRWFALVRLWSPWLAPRQGTATRFVLDREGVLLSFLRSDGLHVVCLALSGVQDVLTTFIHGEDGSVEIKGRNDREETGTSRVLVAVAESFEVANAAVMYHARKVVAKYGGSEELAADTKQIATLTGSNVRPEWLEEWYDGLTYCTWNGLGRELTEDKIYGALDSLSKNNIIITNLIIDDNWQSLSSGEAPTKMGWSDFEANTWGFPNGMKATTAEIRKRFPNINHIAVWHALLGYWGGIDPKGKIAKEYKTVQVEKQAGFVGGEFTVVAAEDAKRMYDDFYSFLSASGIDSVKTDAQFFLDLLEHAPDRRKMMIEYQDAWTIAHLRHFNSRAISCMSQLPQALFHSQLPTNKPRLLVRNSDDFFPEVEASHAWHIFCNAHNSLFTQHLNVLPDWDMFQTSHSWAAFHAAARCVSGGPIYFTDEPGKHDIQLISQMTAQTVQGKTIILRPHIVGKAMDIYNGYDAPTLLKIGTYVGMAQTGAGIVGVFNVSKQNLREFVHLESLPGTEEGEYVVGAFSSGQVSSPMRRGQQHAMIGVELEYQGWDILTAYAARSFTLPNATTAVQVANMGLLHKMTGVAAVTGYQVSVESNGRLRIWVALKALGVLGLWISDLEEKGVEEAFMVTLRGKPVSAGCVRKSERCRRVLEVDVEKAWRESGEEAGYGNEVEVEIFMK